MKILIQAKIGLSKEELENTEKELSEKLGLKVVILQPKLDVESIQIIHDIENKKI